MDPNPEIIFRSKLPDINIPNHLPLHSYCFENISKFTHRPCLITGETRHEFTFADVDLTSRKVGSALHKLGINKGDVIMIFLPNSPEFIFSFLGVSFIGAVSTTVNPFYTSTELIKQAKASTAKIIITQSANVTKVVYYKRINRVFFVDSIPKSQPGKLLRKDLRAKLTAMVPN